MLSEESGTFLRCSRTFWKIREISGKFEKLLEDLGDQKEYSETGTCSL